MMQDFLRDMGYLTLGSRLKRLGERLQADVQILMDRDTLTFPSGQFPILAALHEQGTMTIGELSSALGVSQPGITRSVKKLHELRLVTVGGATSDGRSKLVSLSTKGRTVVAAAKEDLWPRIERSLAELCDAQRGNLLENVGNLEAALDEVSLADRVSLMSRETAQ